MPSPPPAPDGVLAFDTSTERLAVGLVQGGRRWTQDLPGGAAASAALLPAVHALLADAGLGPAALAAIAFGRGPGAFTGLRTSCAVAQGLAFGLGLPVLPIDSLLIVAEQARLGAGPGFEVGVVMDARMGEVYAGRYRWTGADWLVLQPPALGTPAALAQAWTAVPPAASAGSALLPFDEALRAACPPLGRVALGDDRAAALLALAERAWASGAGVDAALALPLYLRDKVALTSTERAAAKAAAGAS